jgi:ribosomal protein S27AE
MGRQDKTCSRCGAETDGTRTYCKPCYRAYGNEKYAEQSDEIAERRKLRRERDGDKFRKQNLARRKVYNAIQEGLLVRQPCEICGDEPADAHHDDYDKPLDVRWLCRKHHMQEHN